MEHRVFSAVGPDRPGLVEALSSAISTAGGSIADSRMALLGGEFAVIMLVTAPPGTAVSVEAAAAAAAAQVGLTFHARITARPAALGDHRQFEVEVSGLDRPGIVQVVAQELARRRINVTSLESELVHAPLSGTPTFVLRARLQVPSSASVAELRQALEVLGEREHLEVELSASV